MILVTGFGPFLQVRHNPSGLLAREVHGRRVAGETVVGVELPVSYDRGPGETLRLADALLPRLVLGLGVAVRRRRPEVERLGRNPLDPALPDVDGEARSQVEPGGPEVVAATLEVARLARGLRAEVSEDAGRYVCNAWLYRVARALPGVGVAFLHLPPEGLAADRLMAGLQGLVREG